MSAEVIKQITDAVIPVLVTVSLAMLPPLIAKGIAWARGKANETAIGAQSKIDDLFFDELEGAVAGLKDTAAAWKAANGGTMSDADRKELNKRAVATAMANLQQHGADFIKKVPVQAAEDWIQWHVDQSKPVAPVVVPAAAAARVIGAAAEPVLAPAS